MPRWLSLPLSLLVIMGMTTACGGWTLNGNGLRIELPRGWSGEIYRRGADLAVMRVESFVTAVSRRRRR